MGEASKATKGNSPEAILCHPERCANSLGIVILARRKCMQKKIIAKTNRRKEKLALEHTALVTIYNNDH